MSYWLSLVILALTVLKLLDSGFRVWPIQPCRCSFQSGCLPRRGPV